MFLTWCLTLLVGGSFWMVFQDIYGAYRSESGGGYNGLVAAPYPSEGQSPGTQDRKAAIIIDDLGPELELARGFWELEFPVTLAVLPYQRHSQRVAREAHRHGKEVILHLPMQPKGYPAVNPGTGSLLLSMDRERIQQEVAQQLDSMPRCVGVSNHMGSLFTGREESMRWVLSVLAERHLFFVDSLTTPDSVARRVAGELRVPFAQRTHFLDVDKAEDSIVRQLCSLVDSAVRNGGAIGIAHPSDQTLAALPKVITAFEAKNVRLVPVSEMVTPIEPSSVHRAGAGRDLTPDP
jgi:hypothetical protein